MIRILSYVYTLVLLLICCAMTGQTFPCDGNMMISTNQGTSPQLLFQVQLGPFGTVFFNPVARFSGAHFNALGFNPRDNYIYSVRANSNEIVRLRSDDTFEVIGEVPLVEVLNASAGDCSPLGHYLLIDNELNQLLVFDVIGGFELVAQVDLVWDEKATYSGSFTARVDDFAIDPTNPSVAYAFQGDYFNTDLDPFETRGTLLRINIDVLDANIGKVIPVGRIPNDEIRQLGSLMFTKDGVLHGYGSKSPGPNLMQNTILQIDKNSGNTALLVGTGPNGISSDGCSCPYALTFENDVQPRDALCTNSELTYTLTINNRFFEDVDGVIVADTLPQGMIIEAVSGNFKGNILPETGIGNRHITITGIEVPAQDIINIIIKAKVNDVGIHLINNLAHLSNLPERMGGSMISDDPQTSNFTGDSTDFWGVAQIIENVAMDITHPTDCINANDGQAILSSPVFIIGEPYTVNLRDEEFDVISREVFIDEDNSLLLDSLPPGAYELFQITPQSANCSFALKDTTLNIVGPDEQIKASASSNAPLCEGQELHLSAEMSPAGSISWKGPYDFKSRDANLTFQSATSRDSGTYIMTARYGGCKQIRYVDVHIAPAIEAAIIGMDKYCERDDIVLTAQGRGEMLSYQWKGPDNLNQEGPALNIPNVILKQSGQYELVIGNGFCQDTIEQMISIAETPTIAMEDLVVSQFCDPLVLAPTILSAKEVSFQWSPADGLDCADCPAPTLLEPILPVYNLNVATEEGCADSLLIQVVLDPARLVYVPNVFSPNADGTNDNFQISPGCGLSVIRKLDIIDRWGSAVFSKQSFDYTDVTAFWDGTKNGLAAAPGVYQWFMELELVDGRTRLMSGNVTLLP